MNAWFSSVMALAGVLIGGLISWLINRQQLRHQEARDRTVKTLEKLEELHQLLGDYSLSSMNLLFRTFESNLKLLTDSIESLVKSFGITIKLPDKPSTINDPMTLDRIVLLVGIYAPNLSADLDRLMSLTQVSSQLYKKVAMAKHKRQIEQLTELVTPMVETYAQLDKVCSELQAGVITESRKYF